MRTFPRILTVAAALALVSVIGCSSQPTGTGTVTSADEPPGAPPYDFPDAARCCASVDQGPANSAPQCITPEDCCSGHCDFGSGKCACNFSGGFCAANSDCCTGTCQNLNAQGIGFCH